MLTQNSIEPQEQKTIEQSHSLSNLRRMLWGLGGFSFFAGLAALYLGIQQDLWPLFLLAAVFTIAIILIAFALTEIWKAPQALKLLAITLALEVAFALTSGIFPFLYGIPMAFIAVVVAFVISTFNPTGWLNEWIIGLGLIGALGGAVLSVLTPFPYLSSTAANVVILALTVISMLVLLWLFLSGLVQASLRLKLTLGALGLAILPLIVLAAVNLQLVQNTVTTQANQTLQMATQLTVDQMDTFLTSTLTSLETEASLPVFASYLNLNPAARANSQEEVELAATLKSLGTQGTLYTPSYGVLDLSGTDIYDTFVNNKGKTEATTDYFKQAAATHAAFTSSVEFAEDSQDSFLYFIAPISDTNQKILGYLRLSYDSHILQTELQKMAGIIGAHSYPILLDENGLRLADTSNPNLIYRFILPLSADKYTQLKQANRMPSYLSQTQTTSEIPEIAKALFTSPIKPYEYFTVNPQGNNTGVLNSATYGTMTTQKWYVVYLQEQSTLVATQQSLTRATTILAVLIAGIVAILVTVVSNLFTRPILQLTQTAESIASGELDKQVPITTSDEIGTLGRVFNSMTQQLKNSFDTLEGRVRERTQQLAQQNDELQYRARQLQTVADVARSVVSTTDMESLLTRVTTLISDRFNYYHVGIFLLDSQNEYAVLRASNSSGGQKMLNRQHKLRVGQVGIVGYVTGTGNPRIATDVGKDAVFFNNPDLPATKSEMALPLKVENRVIGALDIQSTESNAFTEEDINLFEVLADQISVAIRNNQLLADTQKALDEAQVLHRQYLNQEWSQRAADAGSSRYKYSTQGLSTYTEELPEVKMVFETGRPVTRSAANKTEDTKTYSSLAVPILLRGEVIGVIHLQENENSATTWSENELTSVQAVADQLAQTLESARLFEQTIRRADRERRVLEITSKIRSTNDPQHMIEIALQELKRHLGASQAQIVINVPGEQIPGNSEPEASDREV